MKARALRFLLGALILGGIALAVIYRDHLNAATLVQWVNSFGPAGPLVFMAVYALATVLFLPGSVISLAGGALFGPVWGTLYNLTGATLGATLAFLVARYLAAAWAERLSSGRIGQIQQGVAEEGWRFVAFVRLVPLFPFNALNYALGLTRIRLWPYLLTSYLCMLPGAIAYTYLGYAGREAVAGGEGLIRKGLLAIGLLAAVLLLPRLISRLRRKPMIGVEELRQRLEAAEPPLLLDVRPANEFNGEQGHIADARSIPLESLAANLAEFGRDQPIMLVCRTDRRSEQAARLLTRHGYQDVHVVQGGMTAWNARGYPVER